MCDEAEDIKFSTALILLMDILKKILAENPVISEEVAHQIKDAFIDAIPTIWKQNLKFSA